MRKKIAIQQRIEEALNKWVPDRPEEKCWEATSSRTKYGYGRVVINCKHWLAHRLAYSAWIGPIPEGKDILHKCDNPPCCNPAHLYAGNATDNARDMFARGRQGTAQPDFASKVSKAKLGVANPKIQGEKHHGSKLTDSKVRRILKDQRPYRKIAEAYGVTYGTIQPIKAGHKWKHIERQTTPL